MKELVELACRQRSGRLVEDEHAATMLPPRHRAHDGDGCTLGNCILSLFNDKTMAIFQASFSPTLPVPEGGFIEPETVSDAVAWLASDASRYVTGLAIPVDARVMAW